MYRLISYLLLGLLFISCVKDPVISPENNAVIENNSAIIICEGLFGYNNSSITVFSFLTGKINNNIFKQVNGFDLGDIANSSIIIDSCLYIVVSTSRILYKISIANMRVQQILTFPSNTYPRQIINQGDYFYISEAYTNKIYKINQKELKFVDSVIVGVQPEGICIMGNYLYVVNSGWGDINTTHPEANTIYQVNINNLKIEKKIKTFRNPVEIISDTNNKRLFITYYNLHSQKDSTGGIVEYDGDLNLKKHFKGNFLKTKLLNNHKLLSLIDNNPANGKNSYPGLALIDLNENSIKTIIINNKKTEFWYNFLFDTDNQQIWICNAMDFQSNGKIEIYNTDFSFTKMEFIKSFYTGLNPNQILLLK